MAKGKKRKVEAWDDISDDAESESGSDDADWIMHEPPMSNSAEKLGAQKKSKGKKPKKASGNLNAFASADDYLDQIETDLASMPADVASSGGDQPVKSTLGRGEKKTKLAKKLRGQKA